jgi:superfamily II DNA or RNA helicase
MTQHITPTLTIVLPRLIFGPIKQNIGKIWQVADQAGERKVISTQDFRTTSRLTETLYTLEDGQKILITKKKRLDLPSGVDGVLHRDETGTLTWVIHTKTEEIRRKMVAEGLPSLRKEAAQSWPGKFNFRSQEMSEEGGIIKDGLRPPQIGGLHSIGSHWSLHKQAATVVMPTGTGKTETMLATLVAFNTGTLLVVVPSEALRNQTANKFLSLGLLRKLGNLHPDAQNPIVGVIENRPKTQADLEIFEKCNVIISTMAALADESTHKIMGKLAERVDTLMVDEAHHIGAKGWAAFRENFNDKKVLQFTATPYRRDGKLVDGKVIYEYPLRSAQKDGYFKKINFESVYEIDQKDADEAIAAKAVECLRKDLESFDHIVMARCENIERAKEIHAIYTRIAPDLNPILVHSKASKTDVELEKINARESRIVVCVNMLGEGFDLPQLKIAAVHDTHKSLAILLQFTGRFTRTAGGSLGEATVIANIADQDVSSGLERLYSEDADWNQLLSEFSSEAAKSHKRLVEFLSASQRLNDSDDEGTVEISNSLLRPTFSTLMYEAQSFKPKEFIKGVAKGVNVHSVWIHTASNTLYFVTRQEPNVKWTRSHGVKDREWHLNVFHYDSERKLLYVASSDTDTTHDKIAKSIGGTSLISGDIIFRSLGRINRLKFQNVGVMKHGRRNLRYALYAGADVTTALSITETTNSVKSNLNGSGWEAGEQITIGCSYKGRVWAREPGSIPELIDWCGNVGDKIRDNSIDTSQIIANVLIPEEVDSLPDIPILSIEWPIELLKLSEERVVFIKNGLEKTISLFDLKLVTANSGSSQVEFSLISETEENWITLLLTIGGADSFTVARKSETPVSIKIGQKNLPLEQFFNDYPPLIRFIDLSELDGNLLIKPQHQENLVFPEECFEVWDWSGVDIKKESIWKNGNVRRDSIQWKAAQNFISEGFDVVFDDDSSGEAADLICMKEEGDYIRLVLAHCKFTTETTPGERIKDVVEVSSQAVRSAKWKWKFKDLCHHILEREKKLWNAARGTRFLTGQVNDMNRFAKLSRTREIRPEIIIVQPGITKTNHTPDQVAVLASAHSYLKETIGVEMDVICSA